MATDSDEADERSDWYKTASDVLKQLETGRIGHTLQTAVSMLGFIVLIAFQNSAWPIIVAVIGTLACWFYVDWQLSGAALALDLQQQQEQFKTVWETHENE